MNKNKKLLSFMMGLALAGTLKAQTHASWGSDSGGYDDSGYGSGSGDNGAVNLEGLGNPTNGWGGGSDGPVASTISDLPTAPELPAVDPSAPSDVPASIANLPSAPAPAAGTPNATVAAVAPTVPTIDASADIHAGNAPAPANPWTLPAAPPMQPTLADAAPVQPTIVTAMVGGASYQAVNQQAVVKNGIATFSANGTAIANNAPTDGGYGLTTSPTGLPAYGAVFAGPVALGPLMPPTPADVTSPPVTPAPAPAHTPPATSNGSQNSGGFFSSVKSFFGGIGNFFEDIVQGGLMSPVKYIFGGLQNSIENLITGLVLQLTANSYGTYSSPNGVQYTTKNRPIGFGFGGWEEVMTPIGKGGVAIGTVTTTLHRTIGR